MRERGPRTHTLIIEVPLDLNGVEKLDYHPVEQALNLVMTVSKLAIDGVTCDDVTVRLEAKPW